MGFRAIKAKTINRAAMLRELKLGVQVESKNVFSDFEKTTKSWNNKVRFIVKLRYRGQFISFIVKTDSKLYKLLDITGAKKHAITAKPGKTLSYQGTFTPKTAVGVVDSNPGGKSGSYVVRKAVMHPGFKARGFSKAIAKIVQKRFLRSMQIAMKNAVDVSGHRK